MLNPLSNHVSAEDAFHALGNSRRRHVILLVSRARDPVPTNEIAQEIAAIENNITPKQVTTQQRTRVYNALIQTHLDLLDEFGIIKYDDQTKIVTTTRNTSPIATFIEILQNNCKGPGGNT